MLLMTLLVYGLFMILASLLFAGIFLFMRRYQKQQEILSAPNRRMSAVFNTTSQLIVIMTPEGILTDINRAALEMSDTEASGVLSRPLWEAPWWDQSDDQKKNLRQAVQKAARGEPVHSEAEYKGKDGQRHFAELSFFPVKDKKGTVVSLIAEGYDISDFKKKELELRAAFGIQPLLNKFSWMARGDSPLSEMLENSLTIILSVSWLNIESKGAIFIVEGDPPALVMKAQQGLPPQLLDRCQRVAFGHGLCGRAAVSRKTEYVSTVDDRHEVQHEGIQGLGHCCVPIIFQGELMGVLTTFLNEGHELSEDDSAILQAIADSLAESIKRRKVEEELLKSTQLLSLTNSLAGIGSWEYDIATKKTVWSEYMYTIYGLDPRQGVPSFDNLVGMAYPDDREKWDAMFQEGVRTKQPQDLEFRIIRADGQCRWLHVRAAVYERVTEGKTYFHGAIRDITQQKESESKLEQAAQKWRKTFDSIRDIIFLTDMEGTILQMNKAFVDFVGDVPQGLIGKRCHEIITEPEVPWLSGCYKPDWEIGKGYSEEVKDAGGKTWLISFSSILDSDGKRKIVQIVHVAKDVTELKQAQAKLEKAFNELQKTKNQLVRSEKMASIGQLAAGVAHEINNPIGFITNNIEVLQKYVSNYTRILHVVEQVKIKVDGGDVEQAKATIKELKQLEEEVNLDFMKSDVNKLLEHSVRGLERVRKIVLDLRTFAREDNVETKDIVKVEDVIDSILDIVQSELKYKADLVKDYGDTPTFHGNSQRLGQVFINILVNAAQSMEGKGKVTVKTYKQDQWVCVDIIDTGKGIPEENLNKIFDPFFTTKPVGQGTGLGLSISYDLVKQQGGEIRVQSVVGKGTTFTVMLPISEEGG